MKWLANRKKRILLVQMFSDAASAAEVWHEQGIEWKNHHTSSKGTTFVFHSESDCQTAKMVLELTK